MDVSFLQIIPNVCLIFRAIRIVFPLYCASGAKTGIYVKLETALKLIEFW